MIEKAKRHFCVESEKQCVSIGRWVDHITGKLEEHWTLGVEGITECLAIEFCPFCGGKLNDSPTT